MKNLNTVYCQFSTDHDDTFLRLSDIQAGKILNIELNDDTDYQVIGSEKMTALNGDIYYYVTLSEA